MKMKLSFSPVHLHAAKALSLEVEEIEAALAQGEEDEFAKGEIPVRMIHDGYAANAIISSTAFLEASVNEVFDLMMTAAEGWERAGKDWTGTMDGEVILYRVLLGLRDVDKYWFKNKNSLKKYQLLLVHTGREPFDTGEGLYQRVNTVRRLRNDLIHFEPDWYDSKEEISPPGSIPNGLDFNPFYETTRDPKSFLSHEIVDWAIESCALFALEFRRRLDIEHSGMEDSIEQLLAE
ncbi:hypothetical protein [Halorarum salinum]|uniref:Uncharacterized protein n=1 Tax=Halorarum salinum TaxID=2743089 RepID=A0A7D5QIW8_9EURY|nr:hypothetical protein [Halobaculum salinum]QLG63324.1 hypothetical protein HUG12_16935 [Halobaculum salinum]